MFADWDKLGFLNRGKPRLLMFCGKGGVGKTTMSAASAIHFARGGAKTLLVSSDPSPSVSDILEADVHGKITQITSVPGLDATELNYETVVELWKKKFGDEVYDVISAFLPVERDIIDYVAQAPGIDYEFALSYIYDLYRGGGYDTIVWDMAPAGGALSLISLQEKFYSHLGEAAKLYLRVQHHLDRIKGKQNRDPLKLINDWMELSRSVLSMLRNPSTVALIVTIPEGLGVAQTHRVIADFRAHGINVSGVIVNYLIEEEGELGLLRRRKEMQTKYLEEVMTHYESEMRVVTVPLFEYEIKGLDALGKVERELFPAIA